MSIPRHPDHSNRCVYPGRPPGARPQDGMPMSNLRGRILGAASLVSLLLATLEIGTPVAAAPNITYQLYGTRNSGWGFTNTSLTTPGPPIEVVVGDNLTLNLTSLDGRSHNWYIDYNNNSLVDANETGSSSPTFRTGARLWNFTVSNRTGTFPRRAPVRNAGQLPPVSVASTRQ